MIPLYLSEGEAENIRGDIAFAQSCLETGNFTFSGSAVELSQNNFCGMGVTQNGETGNSFKTPQLGIRAQIQHLKAYSTGEILTKFPDKGFSNNPAKTVWKPDMTNISPELRKMFRERKQPEDGETK